MCRAIKCGSQKHKQMQTSRCQTQISIGLAAAGLEPRSGASLNLHPVVPWCTSRNRLAVSFDADSPLFLPPPGFNFALIPTGVSQLVEIGVAIELWKVHVRDFAVWLCAFLVTTFAGVEIGLMASIALSLLILILEVSFPHTAQLGQLGKTNVYR